MAGGRGERMRSSGAHLPKPLMTVRGVSLLERNLYRLLAAGLDMIVVSVPAGVPEIGRFAETRGAAVAAAAGARLALIEETSPLGNIGCAGHLRGQAAERVLVTYADNLTALDLRAILDRHAVTDAACTLAVHEEEVRLPYGELSVCGDRVVEYREKPQTRVLISSAVSVLSPPALRLLPLDRPTGLVDLFSVLQSHGLPVAAFRHQAPWVDVNDTAALGRAEELVAGNWRSFECWADPPAERVGWLAVLGARGVLLVDSSAAPEVAPGRLPTVPIGPEQDPADALAPLLAKLGAQVRSEDRLEFDDLAADTGALVRHIVVVAGFAGDSSSPAGTRWVTDSECEELADPVARRIVAVLGR